MRVLILANSDGGLYKFRREVIEEIIKNNNEVYVCLPDGKFIEDIRNLGAKIIFCSLINRHGTNPFQDMKLMSFYKKIIKEINADIVLTYTIKPNVYGGMACASLKVPYVVNITGLGTAVENGGIMQKITLTLYKRGLRKAQKVFFQNTENEEFMLNNKVVKGDYGLLPGSGVNLKKFPILNYPSCEKIEFAFISRIMKEKGIEEYIEMAKHIKKKYKNTEFHICGACEQEYEKQLEDLTNKGIVKYHGMIKDISGFLKEIHCVIHPTYYPEGMSNVLLEACASGRPIITTDRAGCREIVDNEKNGFIVEQKNSKDLIEKVEKFIKIKNDEKYNMGKFGRKKVEKQFDRNIVVRDYMMELGKA